MALPYYFDGSFNYDYIDARPGIRRGYVFRVCAQGHENCGCMRGRPRELMFLHDPAAGDFPLKYIITDFMILDFINFYNLELLGTP
eukprot:9268318-Karenia_brevis.AAC.1